MDEREFKNISPSAFWHIYYRTFYDISFARKISNLIGAKERTQHFGRKLNDQKYIIPIMEARYKGGEKVLESFIKKYSKATVIELACGFSLHGKVLAEKYPTIKYIETDLFGIIKTKKYINKKLFSKRLNNLSFVVANALSLKDIKVALSSEKQKYPLIIYNEGLLNYLTKKEKIKLVGIVKNLLKKRGGVWITPDPAMSVERHQSLAKAIPGFINFVDKTENALKQKYSNFSFKNEKEADEFFKKNGFKIQKIAQSTGLNCFKKLSISNESIKKFKENIKKYGKVWVLKID